MPTLKSLVDETTNIKNEIIECRDTLKQILIDKEIEDIENEKKLLNLIPMVNDLYSSRVYLYKDGNLYDSITGEYKTTSVKSAGTSSPSSYSIEKLSDGILSSATSTTSVNNWRHIVLTNNAIELAGFTGVNLLVEIDVKSISSGSFTTELCITEKTDTTLSSVKAKTSINSKTVGKEEKILHLDISNYNSSYIIGVIVGGFNSNYGSRDIKIKQIWLDRGVI